MTNQVIPVEAVEAAIRAYIATRSVEHFTSPEEYAVAILEAAAPFMLEPAYEQGWEDGREGTRSEVWWQK